MTWTSVGLSSYPDLRGQEQFTNSQRIADQFWSLATDMQQYLPKGYRLSVNEARRSRPRQSYLWNNRAALGVIVAVPFTSRHDEVNHGNALDIGMTRVSDGMNFALSDENFDRMHTIAESRGFTWTGRNFGEKWHIEGATRSEELPPYANARAVADAEYVKHNAPAPAPTPVPIPEWNDDTMAIIRIIDHPTSEQTAPGVKGGIWLHNLENGKKSHLTDGKIASNTYRVLFPVAHDQMLQHELDEVAVEIGKVL